MLACLRRRVPLVLPRPFAFSTSTITKQDAQKPPQLEGMSDLSIMLRDAGDGVSPIIPGMSRTNSSDQSV